MRITIVLAVILSSFVFLGSCSAVYAQDTDIGQSKIHPAHPLYFLKTIRERMEMYFAQTPRVKMIRQLEFATRRIREVKSLIPKKREDLIEPTLERYWSHMNTVLQYKPSPEELTVLLNQTISLHLNVFENIYIKIGDKRARMSIRTAIFRVLDNSDITGNARIDGCKFLSKEASSSALNEVEREILQERAEKCFSML